MTLLSGLSDSCFIGTGCGCGNDAGRRVVDAHQGVHITGLDNQLVAYKNP